MKSSMKGLLVVLAMIMSLVAVQSASAAETYTVEGTITAVGTAPNTIVVQGATEDYEICGIRYDYLAKKYNIVLEEGDYVIVEVSEFVCLDGSTKLRAIAITEDNVTVVLR